MERRKKYEIIGLKRLGFDLKHGEGLDFAAVVEYHAYIPGEVYDAEEGVKAKLLIPRIGVWE